MNSDETDLFWEDIQLQNKGPEYWATMFPNATGESPDYPNSVLRWAGYIYAYWFQLTHDNLSFIYERVPIDVMSKMWYEYHSMMDMEGVVWNLRYKRYLSPEDCDVKEPGEYKDKWWEEVRKHPNT